MSQTRILGIESSCDECSASVVTRSEGHFTVESVATFSQIKLHQPYGGVVPDSASRNHLESIQPMIDEALRAAGVSLHQLDAIAVTNRPGLVGALLVGVTAAKSLAYTTGLPLVAVHHLEGHASSIYLGDEKTPSLADDELPLPCLLAIVSGGHSNLYVLRVHPMIWPPNLLSQSLVGRSRDDAAGEAFDKTAKLLGFPYPGGVWIDQTAQKGGNPAAFDFPRALPQRATLDYSFSGLKTAVALRAEALKKSGELESRLPDLCASIQEAIVDALVSKMDLAIEAHGCRSLAVVGGVAANSRLRSRLEEMTKKRRLAVPPRFPPLAYCSDNAAMIAAAGTFRFLQGGTLSPNDLLRLNAVSNPEL